ncbi:hypothetical protein ASPSYDRAFT_47682 [Aspergillus sydowii CBS 593.65]|uniref:Uncharacterized protein n=1 Tax=Aspergillus sydowii CBS 593.65 TaxID=1036612 RepID=A0A1L9TAB3_9EURO|nr:uncharacterized protein ASPSYDRAFT_47682 [Aspergillus sydowii CBS 593.65]OJJ56380.1 hypothetical protein ASPSYDRAFT_47682 [Aspergillus sydowii CBS 593.65]
MRLIFGTVVFEIPTIFGKPFWHSRTAQLARQASLRMTLQSVGRVRGAATSLAFEDVEDLVSRSPQRLLTRPVIVKLSRCTFLVCGECRWTFGLIGPSSFTERLDLVAFGSCVRRTRCPWLSYGPLQSVCLGAVVVLRGGTVYLECLYQTIYSYKAGLTPYCRAPWLPVAED